MNYPAAAVSYSGHSDSSILSGIMPLDACGTLLEANQDPVSPGDGGLLKDWSHKLQALARFEQVWEIKVQGRPPVRDLALLALEAEEQTQVTSMSP